MFTCCPNCETVFKVSAKHLQQAAGQVRCGKCDHTFNALSNIQETAVAAAANLQVLAEKSDDAANLPDDLLDEAISDPEQREKWQRLSTTKSSTVDTWAEKFSKDFGDIDDDELLQMDHPVEAEADETEDSADEAPRLGGDEQAAPADEVVLVEDAEAFEAAVLATIHATESKAWESSGPHFVGNAEAEQELADEETELPADEAIDEQAVQAGSASEDGDLNEDEKIGAESAEDEDDEWLSNEAEATNLDEDLDEEPDQPSMDFLDQLAEGAGKEADLEDINVDDEDEDELQLLADDDFPEDEDGDEASIDDDLLTYEVEPDESAEDEIEFDEPIEDESEVVADEDGEERETVDVEDLVEDGDEDESEAAIDEEKAADEVEDEPETAGEEALTVDEVVDESGTGEEEDREEGEEADESGAAEEEDLEEGEEVVESGTTEEEDLAEDEEVDESEEIIDEDQAEVDVENELLADEPDSAADLEDHDDSPSDADPDSDEKDGPHSEVASGTPGEEIWLGEITLESAEKDELEFDVPGDKVGSVFMAAGEEPLAPEPGDEEESESENELSEEDFDSDVEGAEEIVLASDEPFDFEAGEDETEPESTPAGTDQSRSAKIGRIRRPATIAGAVLLAFILLAQVTHYFRYRILESGSFGPVLVSVYNGLGIQLTRQWDLDAYDIRRTIGIGSETGEGVVEISAILTNRASFAQPYPVLRLIFTDQWDEALAIRDLNAGEYLQADPGSEVRMAAGEQVAVDIQVLELEDELTHGYRIEICLQDTEQYLRCK